MSIDQKCSNSEIVDYLKVAGTTVKFDCKNN